MSKVFKYADIHPSENTISITMQQLDTHPQEKCDRPCNELVGVGITVENTVSITLHQVDTHPQEKCNRPCNKIVGAVITVFTCQKVFRYADTHPSEITIWITLRQADTLRRSGIDPVMK